MLVMSKDRKKPAEAPIPPPSPRKPNRTGVSLHVYIDPTLRAALDVLLERDRRSLTTEVSVALEMLLKNKGLWPPPQQSE